MISPGYGELNQKLFRLSHMGPGQVHPTVLVAQLAIFERALADMGHPVQLGAGVGAALAELAEWDDSFETLDVGR
jgi:aspartate aminotransferase-like enzyme